MTQPAQIVPVSVPLTNGVVRSFGHTRLEIAGLEFTGGFKSIKRSRKRNREMVRSNSPDPVGKTLGENEYECSVEMYLDWYYNLIQTINQNLGRGYSDRPFTLFISYVGAGLVPYTDRVVNCTFDNDDGDDKSGVTALTRTVEFHPTKIYFGGLEDLADPLVAPPF
jgi:hypothetical protein